MTLKEWIDNFGDNLAEILEDHCITQAELAKKSGLSVGSVNAYIHKQSPPGIKAVINIAHALDMDVGELIDFGDVIE